MRSLMKFLGIAIGIVLLLIVVTFAAVALLVDPNDYRDRIETLVAEQTGRELRIDGDIKLAFFPWIGLEIGAVRLSNAPGFGDEPFAAVNELTARLRLLPLLERNIEFGTLVLDGLRLNLAVDKTGRTNWDDLLTASESAEPAPKPEPEGEVTTEPDGEVAGGFSMESLTVARVRISDAAFSWDDRRAGSLYRVTNLSAETGLVHLGESFPVSIAFDFDSSEPKLSLHAELKAEVGLDLAAQTYAINDLRITTEARGDVIPGGQIDAALAANVLADLANGRLAVGDLRLTSPAVAIDPSMVFSDIELGGEVSGDLNAMQFTIPALQLSARAEGEAIPGGPHDLNVALNGAVDLEADTARVDKLSIQGAGLRVEGDAKVRNLTGALAYTGTVRLVESSPRDVLATLAIEIPETSDPEVLRRAALTSGFSGNLDAAKLQSLLLTLDETTIKGDLGIGWSGKLAVTGDLAADRLNVDRYLPPSAEEPAPDVPAEPVPDDGEATEDVELPLEVLQQFDANVRVRFAELTAMDVVMKDVEVAVRLNNGLLEASPFRAALYDGTFDADIRVDARPGKEPTMVAAPRVKGVQIGRLLEDFAGGEYLTGLGNLDISLQGRGATLNSLLDSAAGKLNFEFRNGEIVGIDLLNQIRRAYLKLQNLDPGPEEVEGTTPYTELTGSAELGNGVLNNRALTLSSPLLSVSGQGQLDVRSLDLNYVVTTTVLTTGIGTADKILGQLKGQPIPVNITGPVTSPKVRPDLRGMLEARARKELAGEQEKLQQKLDEESAKLQEKLEKEQQELDEKLQKEQEKLKKKAQEKIDEGLRKLFD
ncbi:MAG: AsmA family protein [Pseudomonadota bacterium]|nr:AsmA family protein [Pseudomonadota bacterium]